jgi:hypothetical protein
MIEIPAGWFWMGSEGHYSWESPRHRVYVGAFRMAETTVTRGEYQQFLKATGHFAPRGWSNPEFADAAQPAVGVSWFDADAYCEWISLQLGEIRRLGPRRSGRGPAAGAPMTAITRGATMSPIPCLTLRDTGPDHVALRSGEPIRTDFSIWATTFTSGAAIGSAPSTIRSLPSSIRGDPIPVLDAPLAVVRGGTW